MRLRIQMSLNLTPEQVKNLAKMAKSKGHDFDKVKALGKLIRRYLTSVVTDTVAYIHEKVDENE